jgi:integrase
MPDGNGDELYGWAPPRDQWPAGCKPHRDGWVRWYAGRTVFVCGKSTPLGEVDDRWFEKRKKIDAAGKGELIPLPSTRTYREVLSEFLGAMEHRVKTGKPRPLSPRTLHNYSVDLNAFGAFVHNGEKVADMDIDAANSPAVLGAFARGYGEWKASGFDSIVSRVSALFRWAVEMEYVDRFRPGPAFQRPAKSEIRDDRIDLAKSFTPTQIGKLWRKANHTVRCWIALGVCAAFNNSDVGHLSRRVVNLDTGVIDFRRRKTGKVRRVIPLPVAVVLLLRDYRRPDPTDPADADLFFVTEQGNPYSRTDRETWKPSCSISRLFAKLIDDADVTVGSGQNFSGLRTTFYNLCPKGYADERAIIMGRAKGSIDLDHYLEDVGMDRLSHVVSHVWSQVSSSLTDGISPSPPSATVSPGAAVPSPAHSETTSAPAPNPST